MFPVQQLEKVQLLALLRGRLPVVPDVLDQLLDLAVFAVDEGSLEHPGQETRLPVLRPLDRIASRAHRDEGGQIRVLGTESVGCPRSHARSAQDRVTAIHEHEGRFVIGKLGLHRANDRDVIDALPDVREQFGHLDARLTAGRKLEGRTLQLPLSLLTDALARFEIVVLSMPFIQRRLGIEGVQVAGSPDHEEKDAGLCPGRKMRSGQGGLHTLGPHAVLGQHPCHGGAKKTVPGLPEKFPPGASAGELERFVHSVTVDELVGVEQDEAHGGERIHLLFILRRCQEAENILDLLRARAAAQDQLKGPSNPRFVAF